MPLPTSSLWSECFPSRIHHLLCPQIPGMVNVDFADVRAIMTGAGSSLMGQGYGSGKDRAAQAALQATSSPLLDIGIDKATGVVWNITGPPDMTLFEVGVGGSRLSCHVGRAQYRSCPVYAYARSY